MRTVRKCPGSALHRATHDLVRVPERHRLADQVVREVGSRGETLGRRLAAWGHRHRHPIAGLFIDFAYSVFTLFRPQRWREADRL